MNLAEMKLFEQLKTQVTLLQDQNTFLQDQNAFLQKQLNLFKDENADLREQVAIVKELHRESSGRNSKNSSQPPSHDYKKSNHLPYNKGGAKPGHVGNVRKLLGLERVDKVSEQKSDSCPGCGSVRLKMFPKTTTFEYVELYEGRCIVTHFTRHHYRCCNCQKYIVAALPDGVGPSNFGPRFQSSIALLTGNFHLSKAQIPSFFHQFYGIRLSEGVVCKIEKRVSLALKGVYDDVAEKVSSGQETKCVDETTWRDQNKSAYAWVAASKVFSFFRIDYSRSREARDRLLGNNFKGSIITDRYSAYTDLRGCHQFCLAHLKRNFIKFAEGNGRSAEIATAIIEELNQVFHVWNLFKDNILCRNKLRQRTNYRRQNIQRLLEDGEYEDDGKFSRFCAGLLDRYDKLWTYLRVADMEPTNNEAERSLRPLVLLRKKSLGTKSDDGMLFVSVISTVCQTLRKQGRMMLDFITLAMQGNAPALI